MKRVGIPRGLFYYYHYPLWKTFFTEVGAEVVLSSRTNRKIIDSGIEEAVDETCFPLKVYFGHVKELCRLDIDYIFIPRIVSIEPKSYLCPKFMGIPDMIRAAIPNLPLVIDTTVDFSRGNKKTQKEIIKTGKIFNQNIKTINYAYYRGLQELERCKKIAGQGYTMTEAIDIWEGNHVKTKQIADLHIGVLGHGYSLYDPLISMNIIKRLRDIGCKVLLSEQLPKEQIEKNAAMLPKRIFWTLGRKMVGSALHMYENTDIDGIVYVVCFGCGPDSLIGEVIQRKVKNKPFLLLTIDEHTGEGGLVTRLEAFCDMLRRRRNTYNANNVSSYR